MRRSITLSTVLAASVAVFGACDPKPEAPVKPAAASPTPVTVSSPVASPSVSPTGSPVKPGATPEGKKAEEKKDDKKELKPAATPTPKK